MYKKISALKARQNLGQVMNEVALKGDDYIIERPGTISFQKSGGSFLSQNEKTPQANPQGDREVSQKCGPDQYPQPRQNKD